MIKALSTFEHYLVKAFWCLPPDIHERQRFISKLIPDKGKVLDVGGEQRVLESVIESSEYFTINVDSASSKIFNHHQPSQKDLVYDGKNIPFSDQSFDTVLCIDVLEHVRVDERLALVTEMLRVSKKRLICSAPLGTSEHVRGEHSLKQELLKRGVDVEFLNEHIKNGLPTTGEIEKWRKQFQGQLWYAGDHRLSAFFMKLQISQFSNSLLNHIWFFIKISLYLACNLVVYPFLVGHKKWSSSTNRFYLVILK